MNLFSWILGLGNDRGKHYAIKKRGVKPPYPTLQMYKGTCPSCGAKFTCNEFVVHGVMGEKQAPCPEEWCRKSVWVSMIIENRPKPVIY